jgi:hypothetical protein
MLTSPNQIKPEKILVLLGIYYLYISSKTSLVEHCKGEFLDQGDAEGIVIRRELRGHNDKPFGQPTPGRLIGRPI